ncbi:MAG TPA: hypothetical protein VFF22_04900 [Pseudomonas sp.]|uniref:hypothetical protein n=1 Tax=Pseudomonas sp. G34 TaxID=3059083 RepID=UPI002807CC3A|nr:hypothetical protein [Pseudomonas sp. G34]MDQ7985505.1 hypothetical protein [Pseudomonas sp. G34]HZX16192.1 hypothetical protein [Pseudomonas sp.]
MDIGKIEIKLDKRWELQDLSVVTKEYVQLYSFFYVLKCVDEGIYVGLDFSTYPWGGGYSVVNFFKGSYGLTPDEYRLQINRIQYASPGFIELSGVIAIASDVSILVSALCASALAINKTYDTIVKSYHRRRLGHIKVQEAESKLMQDDIVFIQQSIRRLSSEFNLRPEQVSAVQKITNGNELVQLKILLALYRRAEPIQEQQSSGKAQL